MAAGKLLNRGDERRLVNLIRTLERKTTGEIRIHIARKTSRLGIIPDARRAFVRIGMDRTRLRNAVLLYIAAKSHELACIGDRGIHEKVGDEAWIRIVERLRVSFSKGDFYLGLHDAIEEVGGLLARHFPPDGQPDRNELSDEISR